MSAVARTNFYQQQLIQLKALYLQAVDSQTERTALENSILLMLEPALVSLCMESMETSAENLDARNLNTCLRANQHLEEPSWLVKQISEQLDVLGSWLQRWYRDLDSMHRAGKPKGLNENRIESVQIQSSSATEVLDYIDAFSKLVEDHRAHNLHY